MFHNVPAGQDQVIAQVQAEGFETFGRGYRKPAPIQPPKGRPIFVTGLRPRPGAATIPLGEGSPYRAGG